MPKLIFIQPEFAAQSCELPEGKTTVGRSLKSDLVIKDDTVSADHCEFLVNWNEVIVREHGSRNGTWVAGVRVTGQRPVNHGELIRIGRIVARLELSDLPVEDATNNTAHLLLEHALHPKATAPQGHIVVQSAVIQNPAEADEGGTIIVPASVPPVPPAGPSAPVAQGATPTGFAARPAIHNPGRRRLVAVVLAVAALGLAWWWRS